MYTDYFTDSESDIKCKPCKQSFIFRPTVDSWTHSWQFKPF